MKPQNGRQRRFLPLRLLLAAVVALAMTACVTVRLAGGYDEQVDQSATRLQRAMDAHLTTLASLPAGDAGRHFAPSRQFYLDYGVDLRALETRAGSLPKNELTVKQVQLMEQNVEQLRATHQAQDDISPAAAEQFRTLFNTGWKAILTLELAKKR